MTLKYDLDISIKVHSSLQSSTSAV